MSDSEDSEDYTLESLFLSPILEEQNVSSDIDNLSALLETLRVSLGNIENIPTEEVKMPYTPKDITPVYQDTIPIFDGDSTILSAYITACDFLVNTFWAPLGERNAAVAALLLRIFHGKLRGKALQTVSSCEEVETWIEINRLLAHAENLWVI